MGGSGHVDPANAGLPVLFVSYGRWLGINGSIGTVSCIKLGSAQLILRSLSWIMLSSARNVVGAGGAYTHAIAACSTLL